MSHEEFIDESKLGAPEATEVDSIWLTTPSVKPLLLAVAILVTLIGLFALRFVMIIGIIAIVWISLAWIFDSREESDELPLN
jgi:membrane-bound ClpP family serine protease